MVVNGLDYKLPKIPFYRSWFPSRLWINSVVFFSSSPCESVVRVSMCVAICVPVWKPE